MAYSDSGNEQALDDIAAEVRQLQQDVAKCQHALHRMHLELAGALAEAQTTLAEAQAARAEAETARAEAQADRAEAQADRVAAQTALLHATMLQAITTSTLRSVVEQGATSAP